MIIWSKIIVPIIWRHLLGQYLKVFAICVIAFVGVLLSTRLDEIAKFATMGAESRIVLLFALYQIPYILPIAIPISCVISSIILFQQLSHTQQLTAMRASGLALRQITFPILFAGAFLSLANFYIVSELATSSHLATRQLENRLKSLNPIVLLNNTHLLAMKGFYVNVMGSSRSGEMASDVIMAMNNRHQGRLNLMAARNIAASTEEITGNDVSLITSSAPKEKNSFDHLVIENIGSFTTPIEDYTKVLKNEGWRLSVDHLKMSLLIVRTREVMKKLAHAKKRDDLQKIRTLQRRANGCFAEISRRLSVACAVFTFTLMGCSFGMGISRHPSKRGVSFVVGLAAMYLASFFMGKSVDHLFIPSTCLYTVPLAITIILSIWNLKRVTKGVE